MSDFQRDGHEQPSSRELVYDFLIQYKQQHDGNSPTTREIADGCHLSPGTVNYHLTRLEIDRRIYVAGDRRRNIEIVGGAWSMQSGQDSAAGMGPDEGDDDDAGVNQVRRGD
jgi:hypothetical protein